MKNEFTRIQDLSKEDLANEEIFDWASRRAYSQGEVKHLLKNSPIEFLRPIMEHMVEEEVVSIGDIPKVFLEEYEIAALYVKQDCSNMVMLPEYYRDDADFINEVSCHDGEVLRYASDRVKNIEKVLNTALRNTPKALRYFPDKFKTKENCIFALTGNFPDFAFNWQYVPRPLCLDENFITEVGNFCPKIYQYIDPSIKNKYNITEFFLNRDGSNLKYVPDEFKNSAELVAPILMKNPVYLKYAGEKLKNDPSFILPIIKSTPYEIHDCGEEIKSNFQVAKFICNMKCYPYPIEFFNDEIKSDITIAMISVLSTPESMNYISKTLSSDVEFVSAYIDQEKFNPIALYYIPEKLKNNPSIMMKAYDKSKDCLEYVGRELKHNKTFLSYIFSSNNKGKPVSKHILLANLKTLNLVTGNESALLSFCDNSGLDINDNRIKNEILNQIKDIKFVGLLRDQVDLYEYLKSATLMADLQKDLNKKDMQVEGKKIKL